MIRIHHMLRALLIPCFFLVFASFSTHSKAQSVSRSVYFVGHSLCNTDMPSMITALAQDAGVGYNYNYQLIWGACLKQNWDLHDSTGVVGTDSWVELPTGNYDRLILMEGVPLDLFYAPNGIVPGCDTRTSEVAGWFYDMARQGNSALRAYITEPWNEFDRSSANWLQEWKDTNQVQVPLFEQVQSEMAADHPHHPPVCRVPLRQAIEAVVDTIIAGNMPFLTHPFQVFDTTADPDPLYTFHANHIGQYLSALVHFTSIFDMSPVGLTHQTYDGGGAPFPAPEPATALKLQEIVWEVYQGFADTCTFLVGVEAPVTAAPQLDIWPNPSQGAVHISGLGDLRIFDLQGRIVLQRSLQGEMRVALPTGMYVLQLQDATGIVTQRLFVE